MDVTVNMTAEEFQEFMEWRRDRNNYTATMAEWNRQWEKMAEKAACEHGGGRRAPGNHEDHRPGERGGTAGNGPRIPGIKKATCAWC